MNKFIHKYVNQHDVCGVACADCLDARDSIYDVVNWEDHASAPFMWRFARNVLPAGVYPLTHTLSRILTLQAHAHTRIHAHTRAYTRIHAHTRAYTRIHAHTRAYTHTHAHMYTSKLCLLNRDFMVV